MRPIVLTGGAWALSLSLALPALAQTGAANPAAEALFDEGRALVAKGRFAEACPKFEASEQLDPGLGTLLNLAECHEKLGKTASAWAEYRDAIPLARTSGSKVRQDLATQRAAALGARLSTLTIRVQGGNATALEIHRDDVLVQPAELGSAIPVDPGPHTIEASAPGKQKWSSTIEVGGDSSKLTVDVPVLAPAGTQAAAPATAPAPTAAADTSTKAPAHAGSSQRTAGVVAAAVGVVGLGFGTFFGLQAGSDWSKAKSDCTNYPKGCGQQSSSLQSSAKSKATVSTVAFIAGGVALGVGAVLWITAGTGKKESVALGFGPGAAFLRGSFQ
ncbi:MAG: tetratricopeptide repeat protein [Polyangiaceae bacterium]